MAWNRSTENQKSAAKQSAVKPSWLKGAIAGGIIVIGAILAFVFLLPGEKPLQKEEKAETKSSKDVTFETDEAPTRLIQTPEAKPDPNARPTRVGETVNGYILLPSGRQHKVRGVITNDMSSTQFKGKYEIFKHHSENEIACLLTMQPGEGLVGTPRYNGRVTKDFLESLKEPIVINAEDSEEDQELKRNMIEVKAELKKRMDKGEDLEQILLETRQEYQKLAQYKMDLQTQVNEFKKDESVSDQDVEDFIAAANKMLEEKGVSPMRMVGPITRQKIKMMKQKGENQ